MGVSELDLSQFTDEQLKSEFLRRFIELQLKLDCAVKALEDIENFIEYIKKCDHSTTESERARLALEELRK